jgi:hypothetical protein
MEQVLGVLSVLFELPPLIEQGLATGNLQRVGGVIVDSTSRQVVAWLRDGSAINTITDGAGNFPTPLSAIMNAAKTGATLWDGKMTRTAIQGVSQQVSGISQQMQTVSSLAAFTATGQVMNLALSAATFHATMERLDRLTQEVSKLGEVIRAEFARDRDIRFKAALEAARDAFESNHSSQREATWSARKDLFEAREHFLTDFHEALNEASLIKAYHYLIRALYAETSRIRCFVVAGDLKQAKQELQKSLLLFREKSQQMVRWWLGEHPAIFFHKDVPSEDLERFLIIHRWLRQNDVFSEVDDAGILFDVVNEMRVDFWNPAVIEDEYGAGLQRLTGRPIRTFKDRTAKQVNDLSYAELVIENYQRLVGFDLELRSMRLSFDEWESQVSEEELQQHGMGIIMDSDLLDDAQYRLMQ